MAYQTLTRPEVWGSVETASLLLDGAGEKVAMLFHAPKAGDIHILHFNTGAVTTWQDLTGSLQNVDLATGDPDGVADQSGTVTGADTDDNVWKSCTLSADRTVTQDELLAFVLEWASATGNLNIRVSSVMDFAGVYSDLFTASWAKQLRAPILVVEYSDGTFAPTFGILPGVPAIVDFASNSNPSERGNRFNIPYPQKIRGIRYRGRLNGDVDLVLYDSDETTVLDSVSLDASVKASAGDLVHQGLFGASVTLAKDTTYYAVLKPTTTTTTRLSFLDVSTAAHMGQMPAGTRVYGVNRQTAGSGAFTEETTRRYNIELIPDAFDDGAGGGGGVIGGGSKRGGKQ